MHRSLIILTLLILLPLISNSQSFTDSNLPIVIINTDGNAEIPDDPRIGAGMKIIYRGDGQRNYTDDINNPAYLNYNGRINIEIRGSSSQAMDKKQYGFSTKADDNVSNNNVSLLNLPEDNDWILNSMVFDPSLIRNYISFYLSRMIGQYASRTVFCEVVINGQYLGLYLLQEKIKPGPDRVNILKIETTDNAYPDITGGYLIKADKTTGGDPVAWTMSSYPPGYDVWFIHDFPEPEVVTYGQSMYIQNEFVKLGITASAGNTSLADGYPSVIDIPSFVDYMLLNELAANADAYQISTFFHKDRNGKIRAGPLWDMDLTYGNDLFIWGYDRSKTDQWQFHNGDNEGPRFWRDLFNDPKFRCFLAKRWYELTRPGKPFSLASISLAIDGIVDTISEAAVRENLRWSTTGNHASQITAMKQFLQRRIAWMTNNIGSFSECSNPDLPPLVITKIMYAPETSASFPVSNDLEFLEIKNTGEEAVNMTGVYFGGTGFIYKFPVNSMLPAGESKILAGNSGAFMSKYGFYPSGQFTRSLSNTGEKLQLLDGFGNVIDYVEYSSLPPWPDVNANGLFLELTDPLSDNAIPANWKASASQLVSVVDVVSDPVLTMYPTPAREKLNIESEQIISIIQVFDLTGNMILNISVNDQCRTIDLSSFTPGVYIVKVLTGKGSFARTIIKY